MKLLSSSKLQEARAADQRMTVEQGMNIAKRIDVLRETLAVEGSALARFRTVTVVAAQKELAEVQTKILEARSELASLQGLRAEARKPLDAQWALLRSERADFDVQAEEHNLRSKDLDRRESDIVLKEDALAKAQETLKTAQEGLVHDRKALRSLHAQKEQELALAHADRTRQDEVHQARMRIVSQKERTLDYDIQHYRDFDEALKKKAHDLALRETRLTIREHASTKRTH